ncbi:pleckstrin homology-like domain family B member 1 [Trichonephila clavata]|uniref:Pleckstrin homology-like domain family B member 1 n=1 Tax=Trichonephila clavata TaxID=2740835 RepID=A0A8X6KP53_TRICU|nr:pleckstrin homology-like domain family B member 1 [Trichonephila clavata]
MFGFDHVSLFYGPQVHQKERAIQSTFQDHQPLVNHHHQNGNFEVKLRDKPRSQRPLTRYLPIRNSEFDLRQHIESAGHQIELCVHIHLTSTSCHGYLHKLGGTWKTWRKRWFVFDRIQKALLYYSDKGETKLKGGVNFLAIEEVGSRMKLIMDIKQRCEDKYVLKFFYS